MRIVLETPAPRLDRFLADLAPEVPRARWEAWIRAGQVKVNEAPATKGGQKLRVGDVIETGLPEMTPPIHLVPEALDLPTLFEDDRLWIVDKPAGLVVHPGPGHPGGTAVNALLARTRSPLPGLEGVLDEADGEAEEDEAAGPLWPGLVHRLDRFTTGCLAMAKDAAAQAALQAQFKARTVDKRYLALCRLSRKLPLLGSLLVEAPIARHRVERMKMTVAAHGRPSATRVKVLAKGHGLALVECELLTGRTHQIRVHLSHLGAPIAGDPLYGGAPHVPDGAGALRPWPHPALHAWRLALDHPGDGRRLQVEAPLPAAFRALLEALELSLPG